MLFYSYRRVDRVSVANLLVRGLFRCSTLIGLKLNTTISLFPTITFRHLNDCLLHAKCFSANAKFFLNFSYKTFLVHFLFRPIRYMRLRSPCLLQKPQTKNNLQNILQPGGSSSSSCSSSDQKRLVGGNHYLKPAAALLTVTDLEVVSAFLLPVLQETIQGRQPCQSLNQLVH